MRKIRYIVIALIMGLLSISVVHAQDELDASQTVPCPATITGGLAFNSPPGPLNLDLSAEIEGETYSCGVVVVPENYSQMDGRTIELFYVKLHSRSQSPASDPLIYLAGGPGASSADELAGNPILLSNMNSIRESRDIIGLDQRGTGYSNYLVCAPYFSTIGVVLERVENAPDLEATLGELFGASPLASTAVRLSICGLIYNSITDVDLAQYNSVVSAQDIAHFAEASGYDAYNLYGTSYGTRLAQFAMRETPDKIRSVLIDGVVSPNISNSALTIAKRDQVYSNIFAMCAADAACDAAYPNLPERFAALLSQIEETPITIDPPITLHPALYSTRQIDPVLTTVDPRFFFSLAGANNAALNGGVANRIPGLIQALENGDMEWIQTQLGSEAPLPEAGNVSPGQQESLPLEFEQAVFAQPLMALLAAAQTEEENHGVGPHVHWNSLVLNDFGTRLLEGENQDEIVEELVVWSLLPYQDEFTSQTLVDFASSHLRTTSAFAANLIALQMTDDQLRQAKWHMQNLAMSMGNPEGRHNSSGLQQAVNCAEDVPFATIEDATDYLDNSPFPQLLFLPPADFEILVWGACLTFPTPLAASVTDPVTSDIPTLIYVESLDIQTPSSWGRSVQEGFVNSFLVEWGNMGHIAAAHDPSSCVGDIAAAFLDNPGSQPNLSCAQSDSYMLQWVLPE